jgi:heme o synthase
MQVTKTVFFQETLADKLRDYSQLFKMRLSSMVVFSSVVGYLMALNSTIDFYKIFWLSLGGLFTTWSANAINEVIEKDYDRLMKRTMNRPLPTARMNVTEAILAAGIFGVVGIVVMWLNFNALSGMLSALSLLLYAFVYTPLKRISPVAVFVGAIPGALPPLIGFVSATNTIAFEGVLLFLVQFLWQFPHFWAIAWVAFDDYSRAGYKLLPSNEGRTRMTAMQSILYILALMATAYSLHYFGFTGWTSTIILALCGCVFLYQAILLYKECTVEAAKRLMFGSFFYLPVSLLALYFDKIH